MGRLFNPDNPVMGFIGKIGYSIYLNLLWVLCSLPIVTVGASTTALFSVMQKIVNEKNEGVTVEFFRAFRENLRQSTVVWIILLICGIVLGIDAYVLYALRFENVFWTFLSAVFLLAAAAYCIILMYVFPLMAHFENSVPAMLKNSLMIGMRFLVCTLLMGAVYFVMGYLIINVYAPLILLGEGFCALVCSYLLSGVLVLCEGRTIES